MGISNLLKKLKFIDGNLKEFGKGLKIGLDGHVLLHKSVYAGKLGMAFGENPDAFLGYVEKTIKRFLKWGVQLTVVFDGKKMPAKVHTNDQREYARKKGIEKAYEYLKNGLCYKAKKQFISTVSITNEMVFKSTLVLDRLGVQYIIAPYEVKDLF